MNRVTTSSETERAGCPNTNKHGSQRKEKPKKQHAGQPVRKTLFFHELHASAVSMVLKMLRYHGLSNGTFVDHTGTYQHTGQPERTQPERHKRPRTGPQGPGKQQRRKEKLGADTG